jgi:peptide deformylase
MKILSLIPDTDPRLHLMSPPVAEVTGDIVVLAQDMLTTMYAANGCGLAAPQVGHNIRLIVMDCSKDKSQPVVLINPIILRSEGRVEIEEGCLSFPNQHFLVKRAARVKIAGLDSSGKAIQATVNGIWAVCVQHEIDHLDGITFNLRGTVVEPTLQGQVA